MEIYANSPLTFVAFICDLLLCVLSLLSLKFCSVRENCHQETNFDLASIRNFAQESVLNTQRLGSCLQASANCFLIIHCFHTLCKLLQPATACWSWRCSLPGGKPDACCCFGIDCATWNDCLADACKEEDEREQEEHGEEEVLHG
ncbi:hypothetical protein OWV82_003399 [Melia azedarach]|uniref:Uncharacterized protein n=1 Tax=Melia azedarach TaxID=155640 RepID=A0ACC1YKR5_MELAZ|nr:hypothetical protein OWV82_003399 [Melia azedarach]